jgi:hypothetical protein
VVFNGQCASACTMFLSLNNDRTCIAPGASFVFHRAYGASADMNAWGTEFMIRQYPAWVRDWIARNGGLTDRLIRMDYAYASRFMRPCQRYVRLMHQRLRCATTGARGASVQSLPWAGRALHPMRSTGVHAARETFGPAQ